METKSPKVGPLYLYSPSLCSNLSLFASPRIEDISMWPTAYTRSLTSVTPPHSISFSLICQCTQGGYWPAQVTTSPCDPLDPVLYRSLASVTQPHSVSFSLIYRSNTRALLASPSRRHLFMTHWIPYSRSWASVTPPHSVHFEQVLYFEWNGQVLNCHTGPYLTKGHCHQAELSC
jgi:hypothetical protein